MKKYIFLILIFILSASVYSAIRKPLFENFTITSITIYDMAGRVVRTLASGKSFSTGSHELTWDGKNNYDVEVAAGMYRIECPPRDMKNQRPL